MYGIEDKRNTYARLRKAFNKGITCQKVAKTSGWEICGHDVYKALTGEILEIEKWKIIDRALTVIEKEAETVFASYAKTIGANEASEVLAHENSEITLADR